MSIGIWLWLLSVAHACGVAIHLELVDRILPSLPPRISQHYNYIRSGAFYPDAFYNCMGQYDVAEDAHWPPFLANGIDLVHKRRQQGEDTSRLEAFLVGILSHQVSDVSWHSLGIFQGLLRAMAEEEFDGNYEKAHSVLDIGGDMIHLNGHTVKEQRSTKWEFKVADILDLLEVNGYTNISATSVRYCMARGHAAYAAELRVAKIGFKRYARQSPMLFHEMESYFAGGLNDMREQIEECVPSLFDWFQHGTTSSPWGICQVFAGAQWQHTRPLLARHIHHHDMGTLDIDALGTETPHGPSIPGLDGPVDFEEEPEGAIDTVAKRSIVNSHNIGTVLEILRDLLLTGKDLTTARCEPHYVACNYVQPPPHTSHGNTGTSILPSYGHAVLFWSGRLVVSAPHEGAVYVYKNTSSSTFDRLEMVLTSKHKPKRKGQLATRFGHSLGVWKDYLVVTSPGASELDLYDSHGQWSGGIKWANTTSVYGARGVKLVGQSLAVDDSTNSMYIGAPYVDVVHDRVHVNEVVSSAHGDLDDGIDRRFDQIGMVLKLPSSVLDDAVRLCRQKQLDPEHFVLYRGEHHYENAGMTLAIAPDSVLVGSPGQDVVYGFDRESGKLNLKLPTPPLNPGKPSGFGAHMLASANDTIVVGAPAGSMPSRFDPLSPNQEGVLAIYKDGRPTYLSGGGDFQWFGTNGVVVGSKAYVVSPYASNAKGELWEVDLDNPSKRVIGSVRNSFASGFGSAIASNGVVIAVGMPSFGLETGQVRRGGVAIIRIAPEP